MRNLKAKAALTAAIAAARLGNSSEAETYKAVAIKNGSTKAVRAPLPPPLLSARF
jgi:hypothetical protein